MGWASQQKKGRIHSLRSADDSCRRPIRCRWSIAKQGASRRVVLFSCLPDLVEQPGIEPHLLLPPRAYWRNDFLRRPPSGQAISKCAVTYTSIGAPLGQRLRSALNSEVHVLRRVSILLRSGRPSYVPRHVAKIVVSAIQRVFGTRSSTYVIQELSVAASTKPFRMNLYAPSPIVSVLLELLVRTSLDHVLPSEVLWRLIFSHFPPWLCRLSGCHVVWLSCVDVRGTTSASLR